jgi:hypothetical protein
MDIVGGKCSCCWAWFRWWLKKSLRNATSWSSACWSSKSEPQQTSTDSRENIPVPYLIRRKPDRIIKEMRDRFHTLMGSLKIYPKFCLYRSNAALSSTSFEPKALNKLPRFIPNCRARSSKEAALYPCSQK